MRCQLLDQAFELGDARFEFFFFRGLCQGQSGQHQRDQQGAGQRPSPDRRARCGAACKHAGESHDFLPRNAARKVRPRPACAPAVAAHHSPLVENRYLSAGFTTKV
ncbi:hypothetical protein [Lysobacter gummosus]|uniref:hypothetical protein n=1 Tax=Lysobacter gummosus TaxID=262324 RepID=UPI0036375A4D